MKAREKGTNEKFQRVYTIILEDGIQYHPDIIEFENECATDWNELRNQAAIAAMQAIVTNNESFLAAMNAGKRRKIPSDKAVVVAAVELADALIKELKGE